MRGKGTDKREAGRVRTALPVQADGGTGVTRDVSASGIFFETDVSYHIGSKVTVALDLDTPWGKVMLRSDGKIVRVESRDHKVGVAVEFLDPKVSRRRAKNS